MSHIGLKIRRVDIVEGIFAVCFAEHVKGFAAKDGGMFQPFGALFRECCLFAGELFCPVPLHVAFPGVTHDGIECLVGEHIKSPCPLHFIVLSGIVVHLSGFPVPTGRKRLLKSSGFMRPSTGIPCSIKRRALRRRTASSASVPATPKLKTLKGFTWSAVTELLKIHLPKFVRTAEEPAKDMLLAARDEEKVSNLFPQVGIYVDQDETFFIECKKEENLS